MHGMYERKQDIFNALVKSYVEVEPRGASRDRKISAPGGGIRRFVPLQKNGGAPHYPRGTQ